MNIYRESFNNDFNGNDTNCFNIFNKKLKDTVMD